MSKRKRVVLSLNDKINIINSLKKGESGRKLAEKYGVGTSTISDIKKNTDTILNFTCKLDSEDRIKHRKVMRKANNELLEQALYCWYLQELSNGQPISGPVLCKKALELNKKIDGDESFVASTGWLSRFKYRHGIRKLETQGEQIPDNVHTGNSFKDSFKKELKENGFDLDFVYNADETELHWKSLPPKSLVRIQEDPSSGCKTNEERVTLLVCANSTGTHKVPLLLIGKSKNPKCLDNIRIPLIYNYQGNAWVTSDIFVDWYDNTFIHEVKKYQKQIGKQGNVLLLLDNAPAHPSAESLEREGGTFKVKFLPPNVTSSLQPMEQNVIGTLKCLYRKHFLERLLTIDEDEVDVVTTYLNQINLKDCCYMIADAWDSIERRTLSNAWNNILKREKGEDETLINRNDSILEDINNLIPNIGICQECNIEDVKEWVTCDAGQCQIMTDNEIVNYILQVKKQEEIQEDVTEEHVNAVPSHEEAFHALETAFKWYERQTECNTTGLLELKRIRDLAAVRRRDGLVVIKTEIKIE